VSERLQETKEVVEHRSTLRRTLKYPVCAVQVKADEAVASAPEATYPQGADTQDSSSQLQVTITTPLGVSITSDPSGMLLLRHPPAPALTLEMMGADVHGAPIPGANCSSEAQDTQEAWRAVLPNCTVVTCSRAGTLRVLLPDGSVQQRTSQSSLQDADGGCIAAWIATSVDGTRVELPDRLPVLETEAASEESAAAAGDAATSGDAPAEEVRIHSEPHLLLAAEEGWSVCCKHICLRHIWRARCTRHTSRPWHHVHGYVQLCDFTGPWAC
jgi:hypothetical protein